MSSLLERVRPPKQAKPDGTLRIGSPQINLLPPEVKAGRRLKEIKGWLGLGVLGAVVVVGIGYFVATLEVSSAQDDLAKENDRTGTLISEKAKYAPVTPVLAELNRAQSAQAYGGALEVLWEPYLDAVTAVMPADATLETLVVASASPVDTAPNVDTSDTPDVATVTFSGVINTLPDTAAWIDALNGVPGFSDATLTTAQRAQDGNDDPTYEVTSSVNVDWTALSGRFSSEETK